MKIGNEAKKKALDFAMAAVYRIFLEYSQGYDLGMRQFMLSVWMTLLAGATRRRCYNCDPEWLPAMVYEAEMAAISILYDLAVAEALTLEFLDILEARASKHAEQFAILCR